MNQIETFVNKIAELVNEGEVLAKFSDKENHQKFVKSVTLLKGAIRKLGGKLSPELKTKPGNPEGSGKSFYDIDEIMKEIDKKEEEEED